MQSLDSCSLFSPQELPPAPQQLEVTQPPNNPSKPMGPSFELLMVALGRVEQREQQTSFTSSSSSSSSYPRLKGTGTSYLCGTCESHFVHVLVGGNSGTSRGAKSGDDVYNTWREPSLGTSDQKGQGHSAAAPWTGRLPRQKGAETREFQTVQQEPVLWGFLRAGCSPL